MLPHLFRVGRGKNFGRRSRVAELYGAGRVLPERAAAHVDRVVHAARPAALVPQGDRVWNPGARIGACLDDVPAAALPNRVLLHRDAMANRDHPFGELYFLELLSAGAGVSAARRQTLATVSAIAMEKRFCRAACGETGCRSKCRKRLARFAAASGEGGEAGG